MMVMTMRKSNNASSGALVAAALLLLSSCMVMPPLTSASSESRPPQNKQQLQQLRNQGGGGSRTLQVEGAETIYFNQMMVEGDESVVVLEAGPFKFETSCVTYEHMYDDYSSSTTTMSSTSSRTSYSSSRKTSTTTSSMPSEDDMSDSSYYYFDYSYTEYFAALRLTYTAPSDEYLYGSPMYSYYGESQADLIVGSYNAGESRTQTVFAGRDGGYGDDSTLQSTSGYYATINGDMTIGIHKQNAEYLPGGIAAFPEGYDCMIAGFITVYMP